MEQIKRWNYQHVSPSDPKALPLPKAHKKALIKGTGGVIPSHIL